MINVLIPVAGLAKRFIDKGHALPKPLIPVDGEPMIKLALRSLIKDSPPSKFKLIFIVREDHITNNNISQILTGLFADFKVEIVALNKITNGTLCSCLEATDKIDQEEPLIIYTPDVCYESDFTIEDFISSGDDGHLLTFKANSPAHSYVLTDSNNNATRTAEKQVISNDAIVGVYCFRKGQYFIRYGNKSISNNDLVNNEFYLAPIYNYAIKDGYRIRTHRVEKMHVLGTPEDLEFYKNHVSRFNCINKLALCCDHSGFALKNELISVLDEAGIEFIDFGSYSQADSDHYDSLKPCVEYLLNNHNTIGIGICYTGQGFNIAANKVNKIRSALVYDSFTAELARRHNAANFFCLPSHVLAKQDLVKIVDAIINNSFDGGRHATRIRKITNDDLFIS